MKLEPEQADWDLHLCRIWYAYKYATMSEAEIWFKASWGKFPIEYGFSRCRTVGVAVWKYVEGMPKLEALLKKVDRDRVEEVAKALTKSGIEPKGKALTKIRSSAEYSGVHKVNVKLEASNNQRLQEKKMNRGEQWKITK